MAKTEETREMARLYQEEGLTFQQIGDRFGISRQTVHERIRGMGIELPARPSKAEAIDKKRLEDLYSIQNLSFAKVARALDTTPFVVLRALEKHRIPKRARPKTGGYVVGKSLCGD